MTQGINQSRRNLFSRRKTHVIRPPWSKPEHSFTDNCTRCDKCIDACETKIIKRGAGGFPEIDFSQDECTFCKQCVEVCPEPVFDTSTEGPWPLVANINDTCLTAKGVWCQSCKDACEPRAISFIMAVGQVPKPQIDLAACTACGACVSPCPSDAITLISTE
ncbi:ferredoxin-type protein NapF [Shewanella basaltis]|jgi:ferredoxin-type protein NapF|uniref:ferredoxin-type protein NapF n=1 Tax=Shewanella basaltis TaxID=472183 RepID=UPI003AAE8027